MKKYTSQSRKIHSKTSFLLLFFFWVVSNSRAQLTPEITSWIINNSGATGYNNIPSNIQQVQYSSNNVYVSATCIPGYNIGPWNGNPNTPTNQNFVYKITRNPVQNTGTPKNVGLGHIGVWTNGVSIYNVSDGMSYNSAGVWNRNAYFWEGQSFDNCLGHPAPNGEYHHHVSPDCLYDHTDSLNHSPVIGFAFDGFPVYGGFGFANVNGTGPVKRMKTSYAVSSATTRVNGPAVNSTYPSGCFMEDYIYTSGSGDLDNRNGRFCVTPEYPAGIYAYFITLDDSLNPAFPYTFYKTYYGVVQTGNTGPGSGHNTITETVVTYQTGITEIESEINYSLYPNPSSDYLFLFIDSYSENNLRAELINNLGEMIYVQNNVQPAVPYKFDLRNLAEGIYFMNLSNPQSSVTKKVVIIH